MQKGTTGAKQTAETAQYPEPEELASCPKKAESRKDNPDLLLYADLYKNAKMACEASAKLIAKAEDCDGLRKEITELMEDCAKAAAEAAEALADIGAPPEKLTALEKLPADIGIAVQTLFDSSAPKLAEMMVNGITMGIVDMKKAQRVCAEEGCSPKASRMASALIRRYEHHAEQFKAYL